VEVVAMQYAHTSGVFESSYQTRRIREDLMRLAFGHMAGENDALFLSLRNISLGKDPDAPIDPTEEDLLGFDWRIDVADIRADIEAKQQA
jgi:hypothetical protein